MTPARRLLWVLLVLCLATVPSSAQIVISQVYGGGGNAGATLKNDFVELFNPTGAPVTITGWSVQYASATGTSWQVTSLTGTLQPGQHYLVQESQGAGGTTSLPTPDATGTINMSATVGKVALVSNNTALTAACPTTNIVDFVGFGTTANCFEGTGPTPAPSNTTAVLRTNACFDGDNNATDFAAGSPNPRNSTATATPCLAITTSSPLPDATTGTSYSVTFAATAGSGSGYTFSLLSGTLPPGLTLSGNTLSGNPTTVGVFTFIIKVTDSLSATGQKKFQLTVKAPSTPPTATAAVSASVVELGSSATITVTVTPGTNPTSSGISVTADLSSLGGSSTQALSDDGLHNDGSANDNVFGYQVVIGSASFGVKTIPISVLDAQSRTATAKVTLTVLPAAPVSTVKISQVYGGGGNSGSTYTNDFIELFNSGATPVDLAGWSVQYTSSAATNAWQTTPLCPSGSCLLQPGHYFLVQESLGAGGTTPLPTADLAGSIPMGAGAGHVALLNYSAAMPAGCPAAGSFIDLVGYGLPACHEGMAGTATLTNTTAALRRNNGCVDTDNNADDFVAIGPIPRNSASPAQFCGGDPSQISGVGAATPGYLLPASNTLLTVKVTPATNPPSTNLSVTADLTNIGGAASQQMYDDGTHGDTTAGDGVYSLETTVGVIPTGAYSVLATITDEQSRTATAPITLTVQSPTCGVERWSVKVGTDPDAKNVDLADAVRAQIADLGSTALNPPPPDPPGPPDNARYNQTEKTLYVINGTMTFYKLETDVDYHVVLQDDAGHTMVVEIPSPACLLAPGTGVRTMGSSPFADGISKARQNFDAHFTAQSGFQMANVPVQVKGVGFFDFIHGQTGVAPNGIELHPVLEINFTAPTTITLNGTPSPSQYGQTVTFTAEVKNDGSSTPTGTVTLLDGTTPITTATLDTNGVGTFNVSSLTLGTHSLTVSYEGDSKSAQGTSAPFSHTVNKADQTISFTAVADKTFGDADFSVSATATSGLPVSFSISSGPATINGNLVHITGTGSVTVRASQSGDSNYNPAPDAELSFNVVPANQTIKFAALADKTYGDAAFTVTATGGASSNPVTFATSGNCAATGANGSTITLTGAGSCTVTASQLGDSNYNAASDVSRTFSIGKATATVVVNGFSGVYDGDAHGASGSASGVDGETLTSLLNLGAKFTDVPGGTANWSFAGDTNYKSATGSVSISISKATPSFSNVSSPTILTGATPTSLSGTLSLDSLIPTGSIAITLNGVTQNAAVQPDGSFSSSFATGALTPTSSGYAISYSYAGDTNFNPATASGTLTVGYKVTPLFDTTKPANGASTVPVRLQLTNAAGGNVSSPSIVVTASKLVQLATGATLVPQDSGNANPGGTFRFNGSAYIFNLSTKGLPSGAYTLQFTVAGDTTPHSLDLQIN